MEGSLPGQRLSLSLDASTCVYVCGTWAELVRPFVVPFAFELFPLPRSESDEICLRRTMARLSDHSIVTSKGAKNGVDGNLW